MSNKFLLQACAFVVLSLASGWIYLNSISFNETSQRNYDSDFKVDLKSPQAIKEALTKAEVEIKEVDEKMDDLKSEMNELNEQRNFLRRFIKTFENLSASIETERNTASTKKIKTETTLTTNTTPSTFQANKNERFNQLPTEIQDLILDVEEHAGRPLVNFNQQAGMVQADFNGSVFIQINKSGRIIVPDFVADAFGEISSALGGASNIKNIVISSPKDSSEKNRLIRFIKDYLGEVHDNITVSEKDSSDLNFSIYYKDL